ncbi:hypothetical protein UFOVP1302_27 [uncultured Caudovirales phage]|uniref:Uncharacterized protein n=1 Tax=uncultured Caudovirales phage TaxID=2100421 RepID=A0A6J5QH61_9CAUD|nr:hypothetical protein UFOVP895_30 [uncultured Caudovirales phage]CAB4181686.1 hypothetical protein UFOVP1070_57 [uncultured Caudovirales phage]CAB4195685.1 hypothetical protein UFOVP1302_27 [uncultured Caudovirales phage]CAB4211644.1 hypothetical protein UFOVP1416_5 [uncultured Caudovirales phage]
MAIDKAMSEPEKLSDVGLDIQIINPDAVSIETEDGGALVILGPELSQDMEPDFSANLAEYMDEGDLSALGQELVDDVESDLRSREDWEQTYKKGLDLLGLKIEDRSTPWPGACGVFHPILSEAAVRFQSQAIMETFPAGGPVKTKIIGRTTPERQQQALRVKEDLNYMLTEKMSEYRSEHERMLFALPLAGAAFKKVYFDPTLGRPTSLYVPAEDFVVPYGASDLQTSNRYTHIMRRYPNEIRKLQVINFYRDVDLSTPVPNKNEIQRVKDKLSGEQQIDTDDRHVLLEVHVDLDLAGYEDVGKDGEPTGVAIPYVVTVERSTGVVLSIYRNWKEDDALKLKRQHFVQYSYIPGFGFYPFGLIHLVGGIAKSATSILRQLVDAGTLANLPAGLKARGLRIKGDSTPLMPGEFRDVDIPSGAIKDSITFLPYKEPSQVLAGLLGTLVEEGRRFASIADLQIGDANQSAPVGTTLALMERAMKVMSAVQARLHASLKQELSLLVDIIRTHMKGDYEYETDIGATRTEDYDGRIDVIPVTDPNSASLSQRVVQYQAALQLAAQSPQMYDLPELHRQMLTVLGIQDPGKIIPNTNEKKPMDPISENMAILSGKPVKAFLYQDHEAHIKVHMSAMQDPKILQIVGQSPQASMIQAAATAHIAEHIGFQYRREIENQLGVELPPPDESLPEDIEVALSKLVADAAGKLLQKDQAEAQQQQIQQKMQDPVVMAQMQDAQNKTAEIQRKAAKDRADQELREKQQQIELERIASQERIAGVNAGIKAMSQRQSNDHRAEYDRGKIKLDAMRLGADLMKGK